MAEYYLWYKIIHVISVISWMAAILYLPRIMVYHSRAEKNSQLDLVFQQMERKLLRIIMTPAMISTYIFGSLVAYIYGLVALGWWFYLKMLAVLGLTIMHGFCALWVKDFARGKNKHSEKFYRLVNEIPALFMIVAVIMVIAKPFD